MKFLQAQRKPALVVRHDDDDVGTSVVRFLGCVKRRQRREQQGGGETDMFST